MAVSPGDELPLLAGLGIALLVRLEGSGRAMEWRMQGGACSTPDDPPAPPAP